MSTSPILLNIQRIRGDNPLTRDISHLCLLHNYRVKHDNGARKIYVCADVHPESLDKGAALPDQSVNWLAICGLSGDIAAQVIDKRLGGPGTYVNFFPLDPELDVSAWKNNEEAVYEHVKKRDNSRANLQFAFEYQPYGEEYQGSVAMNRPICIYYHFTLYENEQIVGDAIEGKIEQIFEIDGKAVWFDDSE